MIREERRAMAEAEREKREAAERRLREWDCDDFEADLKLANNYSSKSALLRDLLHPDSAFTVSEMGDGYAVHGQGRTWTVLESDSGYTIFLTRVHEGEVVSERIGEASEWVKAYGQALNAASGNGFEL